MKWNSWDRSPPYFYLARVMKYRRIGKSDFNASVVALGAWAIGGWKWGGTEESSAVRTIQSAIDHGINLIDTAPIYGFGRSEEILGRAIKDRRDRVILATKCGLVWDRIAGDFHFYCDDKGQTENPSKYTVYRYLHPDSISEEVERSLKRLNMECIDLYQTHFPDSTTRIEDTLAMLMKLKDQGKIRAFGASNVTVEQLRQYNASIVSDQERFSMLDRNIEENTNLAYCIENDIALLAYSPLVHGLLTGKIGPEREFADGDLREGHPRFTVENRLRILEMLKQFEEIAKNHNANVSQLVIAWTFSQHGITHVLCGARTEDQVIDNAKAGEISLTTEEIEIMNKIIAASGNM